MRRTLTLVLGCLAAPLALSAQQPTPAQAKALLEARPDLAARIRDWITTSGLTPTQIRARLVAAGYPENLLDPYFGPEPTAGPAVPSAGTIDALRALGIADPRDLVEPDSVSGVPGAPRTDLPRIMPELKVFGLEVFHRVGTQFQPSTTGPVDPSYKLGPGDELVLILTGDVELAHTLDVTREGFVVVPQVGQLYVSGLTMAQAETLFRTRLARVYSGIAKSGGTTQFQLTVARLRTNQVYVIGDVAKPGSFQVSSAGTVLTGLYLAGGPTEGGSFRRVEVRRGGQLIDTLDLYDYLLRGINAHDVRLESGDVVFVPVKGSQVEISGAVVRPAIYELKPGESLRELVRAAGGFEPNALRRRIQIERILPPRDRGAVGTDRVVIEVTDDPRADGARGDAPAFALEPGDKVKVFEVDKRQRASVTVRGNVWVEGPIGLTTGMKVSDAIRLAGGPKPDVYLGQILISRLNADSTRSQLRTAFRDSTGAVVEDLPVREDDEIRVFSRTAFRPDRYVVITGAVKRPGRIRFKDGMTMRDAVLEADGVTEDAWLTEAEVARLPIDRSQGAIATTFRVPLDSTYLFDRGRGGEYRGPPGTQTVASGSPEVLLTAYDNVLILRQPDWELARTVTIAGQVKFPGRYVLRTKTERLVDLIARAGGLTKEAYPRGAELFRPGNKAAGSELKVVGLLESRLLDSLVSDTAKQAARDTALLAKGLGSRIGLNLQKALLQPTSGENLILQAADSIWVPEFDPTVRVLGAVNSPATVVHRAGWNLNDYVSAAGGFSRRADRGRAYVVQPGGSVQSVKRRFMLPDSKPEPGPGSVVYVPERDPTEARNWAGLLGSIAQILASTVAIVVVATR